MSAATMVVGEEKAAAVAKISQEEENGEEMRKGMRDL